MKRPWVAALVFVASAGVLVVAMVSLSVIGVRLDGNEQLAQSRAELEQRVRLALWRMDAAVGPIVAQENARPYFEYVSFYSAERAYTNMFAPLNPGEVLVPSPLLTYESSRIRIHFQYGPDGALSSPSAPESNMRDIAETGYVTHERVESARKDLDELKLLVSFASLQEAYTGSESEIDSGLRDAGGVNRGESNEYEQRVKSVQLSITNQSATKSNIIESQVDAQPAIAALSSPMKTLWVGDELLLVRAAPVDGGMYLQGCWLDWPYLQAELIDSVADLLPVASLHPDGGGRESSRRLAAAPIRLEVGVVAFKRSALSPLRIALAVAWVCVIGVIVAIGGLLWGTMALSERRATFVSAVTHELRTPLTTFQLYTDLLAENRVPDEEKRQAYFETLRGEATRLRHLVENVLAFARLERGPAAPPLEVISVSELVDRIRSGVEPHCSRNGMSIEWKYLEGTGASVRTNVEIVGQIVTNLVDNACKYAAGGDDTRIAISCRQESNQLIVSVRDYGPGLSREAARKLFRPFAKSANEAAASAPGVGLGLALSRRLARSLGGDLRWLGEIEPGCCFELLLPAR